MFCTLLESNRRRTRAAGGFVVSAAVHIALIGGAVGLTTAGEPTVKPESFITRALFLPPRDRRPSLEAQAERLQFLALGVPVGALAELSDGPAGNDDGGRPFLDPMNGSEIGDFDFEVPATRLVMGNDSAFSVLDVDHGVERYADSDAPLYPLNLLEQAVEGTVFVRYIVDTLGKAEPGSVRVLNSSHPQFSAAVLDALPGMRFRPATIASRRVRQLVEQNFEFKIRRPVLATNATSP